MLKQIFCHGINDLQNQVPLVTFRAGGEKGGLMTNNHCMQGRSDKNSFLLVKKP